MSRSTDPDATTTVEDTCTCARAAPDTGGVSRRALLVGAGVTTLGVAAVGLLAACGTGAGGGAGGGGGTDGPLAEVSDIPVGGAVSATSAGKPVILVQPTAGTIVGLSAICTHQGCTVAPHDAELLCPCHGSVFALDGSVVTGPATRPLPAVDVHVSGGAVLAGKG